MTIAADQTAADRHDPRRSPHVKVRIDLGRVRANARRIRRRTGVPLIAVVKADAYGLGAKAVTRALDDLADDFAFFSLDEARRLGRGGLILGPPTDPPQAYAALGARPTISRPDEARRFGRLPVAVNLDSGMRRFGCAPEALETLLKMAHVVEVWTHAVDVASAERLAARVPPNRARRHAAATSLLDEPRAWLDAVRPGLALYRNAVRVTTDLVRVRDAGGPVGYDRVKASRVGVLLVGYSHGLAPAPVRIGGRMQQILEVGMNTSLVTVDPSDREGDEVVLLDDTLNVDLLAESLHIRAHAVLCRYAGLGIRQAVL